MDKEDREQTRWEFGPNHIALYWESMDVTVICVAQAESEWMEDRRKQAIAAFRRSLVASDIEELSSYPIKTPLSPLESDYTAFILDAARDRYELCRSLWEDAFEMVRRRHTRELDD
jgi:hypothetical protein